MSPTTRSPAVGLLALVILAAGCGDDEGGGAPAAPAAPTITTQPEDVIAPEGEWVVFTVEASGPGLSYRWEVSLNDGATWYAAPWGEWGYYVIGGVELGDDGLLFRCVVSGAGGVVVSDAASLDVLSIVYVDDSATGDGTGTNWFDACTDIESALAAAAPGQEIWVAAGTYAPRDAADRTRSFVLKPGVVLYGGFVGIESDRDARDWVANVTVLSGDIDGGGTLAGNSYHVVTGADDATLDGFTIAYGNANGAADPNDRGAGMYNNTVSPTVVNCTFSGNASVAYGGGMYNESSSPTVTDSTFSGNSAAGDGGGMYNDTSDPTVTDCVFDSNTADDGGGMCNASGSNPTVENCTFSSNSDPGLGGLGGGMYNESSSPTVANCTFSSNSTYDGGGMYNKSSSPTVANCTFSSNFAVRWGAGMCNSLSSPTVTNCTFSSNSADWGGGMFNTSASPTVANCTFSSNSAIGGGGMANNSATPTVTNCILWRNIGAGGGEEIANVSSAPSVSYSCIEGGLNGDRCGGTPSDGTGGGNIGADLVNHDPLFVDPDGIDDTLGNEDDNYRLQAGSPCIDAGDDLALPADAADLDSDGDTAEDVPYDLDGNPRVSGSYVDMGAYEYQ